MNKKAKLVREQTPDHSKLLSNPVVLLCPVDEVSQDEVVAVVTTKGTVAPHTRVETICGLCGVGSEAGLGYDDYVRCRPHRGS